MTARSTTEASPRRQLWREVEDDERNRTERRARRTRRLAVVYDIDGPRVRLGILWFVVLLVALSLGEVALAVVFGLMAAVAALQTARAWRLQGERPDRTVAGIGALLLPLAALNTAVLGAAVLVLTGAAVAAPVLRGAASPSAVRAAAFTLQSALFVGLAAASVVVAYRFEPGAGVVLVLFASCYEVGDYLIGSGSSNRFEGPTAGAASIIVATLVVTLLQPPPFEAADGIRFGVMAIVLAPMGQLAASLILPDAAADAPALRRLDSLLLLGPVFAWGAGVLAS